MRKPTQGRLFPVQNVFEEHFPYSSSYGAAWRACWDPRTSPRNRDSHSRSSPVDTTHLGHSRAIPYRHFCMGRRSQIKNLRSGAFGCPMLSTSPSLPGYCSQGHWDTALPWQDIPHGNTAGFSSGLKQISGKSGFWGYFCISHLLLPGDRCHAVMSL